jgi:thiamine pyrophosphokinase
MKAINIQNYDSESSPRNPAGASLDHTIANFLEAVKHEIFAEYEEALGDNFQLLRLVLNEADALARQTGFPHLVFPVLATEKAQDAARWQLRQQDLLRTDEPLAA